jgi:ABC-type transport system substrate-binding protein
MRSIRARADGARSLALATALLALAGCRRSPPAPLPAAHGADATPRRGGTLHLASFGDVRGGLDPAGNLDGLSLQPIAMMFPGLVDYDEQARPVPELADHWEVDDGGRTYRFVLRRGVKMHDGDELTADDVERSIERALHPSTPNQYASNFANISGYEAYAAGKADHLAGVTVLGRYVVAVRLDQPDATFLHLAALPPMRPVCKSAGDRYSDAWVPCGAGPFRLPPGGWQRGTSLRIVRHEAYFRPGLPYLDAVEWTYNMQPFGQRMRFERGELDILRDLTDADLAAFVADPRWAALGVAGPDIQLYGEAMNTRMPPFDNVEVRRAVAAAIDREHVRLIKPLRMSVLTQALPRLLTQEGAPPSGQRYDYPAALEHMRRAGYPYDPQTGIGGWPEPISYLTYEQGAFLFTAQILQQDLAKIGLRIELRVVSWPAFLALQQRPDGAAMSPGNWMLDYPDPSAVIDPVFTTQAITSSPEASLNTAFYSNPRVDDLVARAHVALDPAERRALYLEANAIVCDEAPWAFTLGYHWFDLRQPYVRGYALNPVGSFDATRVWLDRDEEGPHAGTERTQTTTSGSGP